MLPQGIEHTIPASKCAVTGIGVYYIVYVKSVKHLTKFMYMFYKKISGESDGR
jgi:hypothetical protein